MSAAVERYHTPIITRRDYETPAALFRQYGADCTLDVCATPETAKCPRYFTREDDGLSQSWEGVCWMNPPYGREIRAWIKKAWEESQRGATVVCLLPARTDSGWWHDYAIKGEVTFLRGRVKFVGCEHNAPFPCAIVTFRAPTPGDPRNDNRRSRDDTHLGS